MEYSAYLVWRSQAFKSIRSSVGTCVKICRYLFPETKDLICVFTWFFSRSPDLNIERLCKLSRLDWYKKKHLGLGKVWKGPFCLVLSYIVPLLRQTIVAFVLRCCLSLFNFSEESVVCYCCGLLSSFFGKLCIADMNSTRSNLHYLHTNKILFTNKRMYKINLTFLVRF